MPAPWTPLLSGWSCGTGNCGAMQPRSDEQTNRIERCRLSPARRTKERQAIGRARRLLPRQLRIDRLPTPAIARSRFRDPRSTLCPPKRPRPRGRKAGAVPCTSARPAVKPRSSRARSLRARPRHPRPRLARPHQQRHRQRGAADTQQPLERRSRLLPAVELGGNAARSQIARWEQQRRPHADHQDQGRQPQDHAPGTAGYVHARPPKPQESAHARWANALPAAIVVTAIGQRSPNRRIGRWRPRGRQVASPRGCRVPRPYVRS